MGDRASNQRSNVIGDIPSSVDFESNKGRGVVGDLQGKECHDFGDTHTCTYARSIIEADTDADGCCKGNTSKAFDRLGRSEGGNGKNGDSKGQDSIHVRGGSVEQAHCSFHEACGGHSGSGGRESRSKRGRLGGRGLRGHRRRQGLHEGQSGQEDGDGFIGVQ